jgi:Na+/melibiose symporter-like transporter
MISGKLGMMLTAVLPMVFIGVCYNHEKHKNFLFWASLLGAITMFAYQLY